MPVRRPAGILWDLDGTLADSEPAHVAAFRDAFGEAGIEVESDFHDKILGGTDIATYDWLRDAHGIEMSLDDWMALRFRHFLKRSGEVAFRPEARAVWSRAAEGGLPQAVVSNSDRMLVSATLDALGLSHPRLVSVTRNDVVAGKPDPEPYLRAARLLRLPPDELAGVEDSPTGLRSGCAAGLRMFVVTGFAGDIPEGVAPLSDLAAALG